jgi:hypothetical protein
MVSIEHLKEVYNLVFILDISAGDETWVVQRCHIKRQCLVLLDITFYRFPQGLGLVGLLDIVVVFNRFCG